MYHLISLRFKNIKRSESKCSADEFPHNVTQLLHSQRCALLMRIRETARELATKDARNRQRPGFTTDSVRFNNITGFL